LTIAQQNPASWRATATATTRATLPALEIELPPHPMQALLRQQRVVS
jgi:hypothetical protein